MACLARRPQHRAGKGVSDKTGNLKPENFRSRAKEYLGKYLGTPAPSFFSVYIDKQVTNPQVPHFSNEEKKIKQALALDREFTSVLYSIIYLKLVPLSIVHSFSPQKIYFM